MKKLAFLLALAMLTTGILAGCGGAADNAADPAEDAATTDTADTATEDTATEGAAALDAIKEKGTIIMGTNAQFPPFEYMADDGSVVGVDVDVANEIAKDLGVELQIVDMDFDLLVEAVKNGKVDFVAAGMTITEDRKEQVDFTDEYVTSSQYVVIPKGSTLTTADLSGKNISCQEGTTGDFFASGDESYGSTIKDANVLRFKSGVEAGMAVATGKADALIIDELPAKAIVASQPDKLELLPDVLTTESYAIAVAKGNEDLLEALNSTLGRLMEDGSIDGYITSHMAE